jgi:hypothetical protein
MALYFCHSSALVKRYAPEIGSAWLPTARQAAGICPITFISADQELHDAAVPAGLAVDDPNTH